MDKFLNAVIVICVVTMSIAILGIPIGCAISFKNWFWIIGELVTIPQAAAVLICGIDVLKSRKEQNNETDKRT